MGCVGKIYHLFQEVVNSPGRPESSAQGNASVRILITPFLFCQLIDLILVSIYKGIRPIPQ